MYCLDYHSILPPGFECVEGDELNIIMVMLLSQTDHLHSITSQKVQIFTLFGAVAMLQLCFLLLSIHSTLAFLIRNACVVSA